MNKSFLNNSNKDKGESWLNVSDMMAGLMMVFLLIVVIYARNANKDTQNITEIVSEWKNNEESIYNMLVKEFEGDLVEWNAIIEKETLTIRFYSPEVLFEAGSYELKDKFKFILQDFLPRYISLLHDNFKNIISEVRIEGHTSSEWDKTNNKVGAFINNMELSQSRTRAVLNYSLSLNTLADKNAWMIKTMSANGLSSAKLVYTNKKENKTLSRRVEFAIRTKTKETLFDILNIKTKSVNKDEIK